MQRRYAPIMGNQQREVARTEQHSRTRARRQQNGGTIPRGTENRKRTISLFLVTNI